MFSIGGPTGKSATVVVDDLLRLVKDLENKMAARRRADSGPVTPKVSEKNMHSPFPRCDLIFCCSLKPKAD